MTARSKRRRRRTAIGSVLAAAVLIPTGIVVYQNDYDIREQEVSIPDGGTRLDGVLALPPEGDGPFGLVVFVHGDGAIDATRDGFYRPLWESFAEAGYASLSWNKPGVDGSPGDWLSQSMGDRAGEVEAALAWARSRPEIDDRRIGLWGASQAGWVLPKVARRDQELRFAIAVSPAINWRQQGRYNLLAELRADDAPAEEVREELRLRALRLRLLRERAGFGEYRRAVDDVEDLTAARWRFIRKNYASDATEDLAAMRIPVLLILAGHDQNVDVADTERTYRRLLAGDGLRVRRYEDATHSLLDRGIEQSQLRTFLTAVFAPRSLFADGFLADQREFLESFVRGR